MSPSSPATNRPRNPASGSAPSRVSARSRASRSAAVMPTSCRPHPSTPPPFPLTPRLFPSAPWGCPPAGQGNLAGPPMGWAAKLVICVAATRVTRGASTAVPSATVGGVHRPISLTRAADLPMTVTETVLVFVGAPLAAASALALLVFGVGARRAPRYRPGRPFSFTPVWFVSAPRPGGSSADNLAIAGPLRPALEASDGGKDAGTAALRPATKKGGAHGTW